jgi:hypothetical protein
VDFLSLLRRRLNCYTLVICQIVCRYQFYSP